MANDEVRLLEASKELNYNLRVKGLQVEVETVDQNRQVGYTAATRQTRLMPKAKQLISKSINHSAFVMAPLVPTTWMLFADLFQFLMRGGKLLAPYRLVAVATGVVWGGVAAWVTNVPQVLYFYR